MGETVHPACCLLPSQREQPPAATRSPPHNNGEYKISPAPVPTPYTKAGTAMTIGQRGLTAGWPYSRLRCPLMTDWIWSLLCLPSCGHGASLFLPEICPYSSWERPSLPVRRDQLPTFMSSRLAGRAPGLPASAVLFCRASPLGPGVPELELLLVERLRDGVGAPLPGVSPAGLRQDRNKQLQYPPSFCRQRPSAEPQGPCSYLGGAGRIAW